MRASTAWAFLWLAACGAAPPPRATAPAAPPLPALPALPALVPPGARVVLVARPAILARSPAASRVLSALFPPELLDSFARRTGVEPLELDELVVAEMDEGGYLLVARGPWPARDVVRAAELRMNGLEASQDEPFFRRAGYLGADRRDLVALAEDVVLLGAGAPAATAAAIARAQRGRWRDGERGALEEAEIGALVAAHAARPLALYAPRPLALPPGFGTSALLAGERALAASVHPEDPEALAFEVALVGAFPEGAEANFRALLGSVASSSLGQALGIVEAVETLSVQSDEGSVVLRFRVSAVAISLGLRMLFGGELRALLEPAVRT